MTSVMFQQRRRNSSVLDLEAASYFELDPSQMQLLNTQLNLCEKTKPRARIPPLSLEQSNQKRAQMVGHKTPPRSPKKLVAFKPNQPAQQRAKVVTRPAKANATKTLLGYRTNKTEHSSSNLSYSLNYRRDPSPSTSTCSLPSISSSPLLSPSLVCPHLSLDDILARHSGDRNRSPHTIGLCEKCLVCPPPNIHSPLSPAFRPSSIRARQVPHSSSNLAPNSYASKHQKAPKDEISLKRGHSDQQLNARSSRNQRLPQDDSLDYYLKPEELRRLQMSPTVRNSVEYIRNNTTEAGRVIRIYKNSCPFDKPLRICIMRGEFNNLNHLLDHINSRQLVPCGARYLFHLDGQLVYSENELKHGSCYIVSGTRNFDFKVNRILKEQQTKQIKVESRPTTNKKTSLHQQEQTRTQQQPQVGGRVKAFTRNETNVAQQKGPQHGNATQPIQRQSKQEQPPVSRKRNSANRLESVQKVTQTDQSVKTKKMATSRRKVVDSKIADGSQASDPGTRYRTRIEQRAKGSQETVSKSNESLNSSKSIEPQSPRSVVRAKSELHALPRTKRKKNVTFVDTGRGSSPAINLQNTENSRGPSTTVITVESEKSNNSTTPKEMETNEIGIQVSDSIEGFLIDLPIALPTERGDGRKKETSLRRPNAGQNRQKPQQTKRKPLGKVVTITERQLSFEEVDKLKDMSDGDHHNEAHKIQHVSITLDSLDSKDEPSEMEPGPVEVLVPDRTDTINIGQEPNVDVPLDGSTSNQPVIGPSKDQWQYPVDPERPGTSTTPTERPISQSEPSETVHARVTTPSPSLSTMGDSNSLALSYDYISQYRPDSATSAGAIANLPEKQYAPVIGVLRPGLDPPAKNFKLVWVNGFIINDQYPENSIAAASPTNNQQQQSTTSKTTDSKSPIAGLLSPSDASDRNPPSEFKPSERFQNWVCHSRRHDELIYPAGSLVILWCRWTNQQRYYSRHTSNVSAITLASLDDDLAASAQIGDPNDPANNSCVHLWSLTNLETIRVVEDDSFRYRQLFSLKVRNTESDGCELSICGREEKRLWFYVIFLRLESPKGDTESKSSKQQSPRKISGQVTIKTNKPLQSNQIPLLVTRLSNTRGEQPRPSPAKKPSTSNQPPNQDLFGNIMVSLGRRHFQVWWVDRRRQMLSPLQSMNKSSHFVETIVRANCLVRMSPSEFLIADSTGNLTLLILQLHQNTESKSLISSPGRTLSGSYKYSLDTWPMLEGMLKAEQVNTAQKSITCLMRISGTLFAAADSNCMLKFWKIIRSTSRDESLKEKLDIKCQLMGCIRFPTDMGFICTMILAKYSRKQPTTVEFYALSTSNAILFVTVQLQPTSTGVSKDQATISCTLSVICEGHESPATSLVADNLPAGARNKSNTGDGSSPAVGHYFTCSLDCKICKWSGKSLLWKSVLPSACASLAVHPVGFVLAIGSADGTVYILDKISGLLISYFPLTPVCINCLAYSRDGTLLAAGCANGSIFILPVYERGLKYKKVSILQSPHPVVSLQFSVNNKYILTSVTHGSYQELILWDLPNFRYMRNNVKVTADRIEWFDSICSGSEDVRAIWENANLDPVSSKSGVGYARSKYQARRLSLSGSDPLNIGTIINLSCHRLIRNKPSTTYGDQIESGGIISEESFVIASDTRGYLRLFRYPCSDIQQGFYEFRVGSSAVSCCRFLALKNTAPIDNSMFVSSSLDGSICLWSLC